MSNRLWTIVPAAGAGRRMGQAIAKQYLQLAGLTILEHSLGKLFSCQAVTHIHVVLQVDDDFGMSLMGTFGTKVTVVAGGPERADSVLNGLSAIQAEAESDDWVLVHDAARPCLRPSDVELLLNRVANHQVGGLLGEPVSDTLKRVRDNQRIEATIARENLWRAYTPQVFRFELLHRAMQQALANGMTITDEASAVELAGYAPIMVAGHSDNIKITRAHDLVVAGLFLELQRGEQQTMGKP